MVLGVQQLSVMQLYLQQLNKYSIQVYDQYSLMTRLRTHDFLYNMSINSELFINFQSQTPLLP